MPVIYIGAQFDGAFSEGGGEIKRLNEIAPGCEIVVGAGRGIPDSLLPRIEVFFGHVDPASLKGMTSLKWLHLPSAGADRVSDRSLYAGDVVLTNSSGVYGLPIAEHVIALFLALSRNLQRYVLAAQKSAWSHYPPFIDFAGSTVGVIGLGDIGLNVAVRSKALGANVIAVKRTASPKPDCVDELFTDEAGLDYVVKNSDFLALCLPATALTSKTLSRERIAAMRPTAYVVNIGRGTAIDQDALYEALKSGKIAGAGLDVTTPEPLPEDSPLWGLDNVIITSHSSGRSPTNSGRSLEIFYDNLERYLKGEPLENVVDFGQGY